MICEIHLKLKENAMFPENGVDLMWNFLNSLYNNGQILKDYKMIEKTYYVLQVTLPKRDSLNEKYDSEYVTRDKNQLTEYFEYAVCEIGENAESVKYCNCKNRSALEMQTYEYDIDSAFICCDCGLPIALYELPYLDGEKDFYLVQNWAEQYSAMDKLWMNCNFERFTGKQLFDPNSTLNKIGRELALRMERKLGRKVYYNIGDGLDFYKPKTIKWVTRDEEYLRICPACGKTMSKVKSGKDVIQVCEDCRISSDDYA